MRKVSLRPKFEKELISEGEYDFVVGIDEVGRGCFAGPIAVGAYQFDIKNSIFQGVNDSKKLAAFEREKLHKKLSKQKYLIKYGSNIDIDRIGIGKVLTRLIDELIVEFTAVSEKTFFIIDGQFAKNFGTNSKKFIKGDATYYSIAAAAILAKVERDALMTSMHDKYPEYRFDKNKGYATKFHREMIKKFGVTEIHRKSFIYSPNIPLFGDEN